MQLRALVTLAGLLVMSLSSAQTQSGIEGMITVAPARGGPARAELPDSAPLANVEFAVTNETGQVASFTTDAEGRFHVSLAPGHYSVSKAERKPAVGRFGPFEVDVAAGKMTEVQWRCDSGMR